MLDPESEMPPLRTENCKIIIGRKFKYLIIICINFIVLLLPITDSIHQKYETEYTVENKIFYLSLVLLCINLIYKLKHHDI